MKQVIREKSLLSDHLITFRYDNELDKLKGNMLAPKKLEDANKILKQLKAPLPKR